MKTEEIIIDEEVYAELQQYAQQHDLSIGDVVAYAWRLYRDMSAMRDDYQVPRSSLLAWQAEHPQHVDDASEEGESPLLEWCSYCWGYHPIDMIEDCPLRPK